MEDDALLKLDIVDHLILANFMLYKTLIKIKKRVCCELYLKYNIIDRGEFKKIGDAEKSTCGIVRKAIIGAYI